MTTVNNSTLNDLWDRLLEATSSQTRSVSVSLEVQASVMAGIEMALDPMGDGGLLDCLTRLWNRFDELSCRPASRRLREQVIADAERVAAALRHAAAILDDAIEQEHDRLVRRVERANELLALVRTHPDVGSDTEVADELSALLAFDPRRDATSRYHLCFQHPEVSAEGALPMRIGENHAIVTSLGSELDLVGGSIHGSQILLQDLLPKPRRWLDEVAALIISSHNQLHLSGSGLDGSTDVALFWPAAQGADTTEVAFLLAGNPERVAAAATLGDCDGRNAMTLARLGASSSGPWALLRQGLNELAHLVADLRTASEAAALSNRRAERSVQEGSASSLSRKMAGLLVTQEALQAAARFDDTLAGVLDTVSIGFDLGPEAAEGTL